MEAWHGWIREIGLVAGLALCLGAFEARGASNPKADSLFQAAKAQLGQVPVEQSLKAFDRVLKVDGKHAPTHYEMARLHMSKNTLEGRRQARGSLYEAIRLAPDDVEYQVTLGDLLWAQGLWYNARIQYEKVFMAHPDNAKAAYGIGHDYLQDFLKYQDMLNPYTGSDVIIHMKDFGEEAGRKARSYLEKSLELNPGSKEPYYKLGILYLESKQPSSLLRVAEQMLKQWPDGKDALLFCGLGHQSTGFLRRAQEMYTRALDRMSPAERMVTESVDLIVDEAERSSILKAEENRPESGSHGGTSYSIERKRFWQSRDPLYLTDYNERLLEHYSRVAYANLRFGQPPGIEGWQTDMGKTYIKFGRPIRHVSIRPDIPSVIDPDAWMTVHPHLETWYYEGYQLAFLNWDGLDGWRFAPTRLFGPVSPGKSMEQMMNWPLQPLDAELSAREVFRNRPPRFVDPYQNTKYSMPHQVASFRRGDSVQVELSYAIPKGKVKAVDVGGIGLEDGLFLFDENWDLLLKKIRTPHLRWMEPDSPGRSRADSLRKEHFLIQRPLVISNGSYRLVEEVRDQGTWSVGCFQESQAFSYPDTGLSMSSLLLATEIKHRTPSPERREDLEITPNPLRTYSRSEPVSLYFEVYNLTHDGYGRTEYQVSYRTGKPAKKEIDPALFTAIDLSVAPGRVEIESRDRETEPPWQSGLAGDPEGLRIRYVLPDRNRLSRELERVDRSGKGTETVVTARYTGGKRNDLAYLQIDMGQSPVGVYRLTVSVQDRRTGRTVKRDALFRMME